MYLWTVFIRDGKVEVALIDHDTLGDYGDLYIVESFSSEDDTENKNRAIVLAFQVAQDGKLPLKHNKS